MATLSCKSCGGTEAAKSGFVRGLQRYRCRSCGCNFTNTPARGKPAAMKAMAVLLYAMGNMSFGMIGRILGVSDVSVLRWVRAEAQALPEPDVPADVKVLVQSPGHRRDVAFREKKAGQLWLWRAYDPVGGRTVAWVLGRRDDATCRRLLDKTGTKGMTFVTDDRDGYHRRIPPEQVFTGKDLTVSIERDNSDIRHFLARFRRRTKVVSKWPRMVDLSLRLYHHYHDRGGCSPATKIAQDNLCVGLTEPE